ncbi:hypothetical protein Agabi119p4_11242 [Agaricus bisporus var. burnettii]|uniref:Uncharacterized protein n=1 Tax=Agaricus bisporus var. burnettii TaxID=192524 RepID=A0A8H7C221_AGABI|nr:hypothetical protein Agabi119p4_11242 [Agaricus bisporus var. burnettii]
MQTSRNLARQFCRKHSLIVRRGITYPASRPSLSSSPCIQSNFKTSWLPRRRFSHSSPLSSTGSLADPSRPDLFYHIIQPPTPISQTLPAYALSFSTEKPPSNLSRTIIGWLPARGQAQGTDSNLASTLDATLEDFVENPGFVKILHSAVKDGLREGVDEIQKTSAVQKMDGWMHIHDERNIPALNRIGDPDDIIGTVLVKNCEIQAETYQPMPSYRLVTADGLIQLTPGLAKKLRDTLIRIANAERTDLRSTSP